MKVTMRSGVYSIRLISDGREYIGSSVNIDDRWRRHKKDLRGNKHHSAKLQRAWSKYGEDSFEFTIMELCNPIRSTIIDLEQQFIDARKPEFNISKIAESPLGIKHTDETRRKVGLASLSTWRNPEFRARHAKSMKIAAPKISAAALQQHEQRSERAIEHNRTYWTNEAKEARSKQRKKYAKTKAGAAHFKAIGKLAWLNQESRSILVAKRRELAKSAEFLEQMSLISKEAWLKPGYREKRVEMVSIAVIGTSLSGGNDIEFKSMKQAAKSAGVSISSISSAIKRGGNSGGYAWRKANAS